MGRWERVRFIASLSLIDWALIVETVLLIGVAGYVAHVRQQRSVAEHQTLVAIGKLWHTESALNACVDSRTRWKDAYNKLQDARKASGRSA